MYRRFRGKRYSPHSRVDGVYYLSLRCGGRATTVCLHTRDRSEAEARSAALIGEMRHLPDRIAYLRALIAAGKRAERELAGLLRETDPAGLDTLWARFVASKRRPRRTAASTLSGYRGICDQFTMWCGRAGVRLQREVTPELAERYIEALEAQKKLGTVEAHLRCLRLVWRVLDPSNPTFSGLHSTRNDACHHYRPLSIAEVARIYQKAAGELRVLVAIGYTTGLRLVDACCLRWDQADPERESRIELERGVIRVRPRKTTRYGKTLEIPVVPPLSGLLSAIPAACRRGPVLPELSALYDRDASAVSKRIAALFSAAGVGDTDAGRASFHSFRATYQTLMDNAGVARQVTRSVTGHTGPAMSDTYSRIAVEVVRRAVEGAIPDLSTP